MVPPQEITDRDEDWRSTELLRAGSAAPQEMLSKPRCSYCYHCTLTAPLSGNAVWAASHARCSAGAGDRQEDVPALRGSQPVRGMGRVATNLSSVPLSVPCSPLLSHQARPRTPWPGVSL